MEVKN